MTHKNPFELRAEVLALAKEYMDRQVDLNQTFAIQMAQHLSMTTEEIKTLYKPYTFEDMMKIANEMYAFVQRKD